MKSFVLFNILFIAGAVAVSYNSVQIAFKKTIFEISQTRPIEKTQHKKIEKTVRKIAIKTAVVKKETPNILKDYTPKNNKINKVIINEKIKYPKIDKKINVEKATISLNEEVDKNKKLKTISEIIVANLSYEEIKQQEEIKISKLKLIAWSDYSPNFSKYNMEDRIASVIKKKQKKQAIQKEDNVRISQSSIKTEEKSSNKIIDLMNSKQEVSVSKAKSKNSDELVFFDYNKEEKVIEDKPVEIKRKNAVAKGDKKIIPSKAVPGDDLILSSQNVIIEKIKSQPKVGASGIFKKKNLEDVVKSMVAKKPSAPKSPNLAKPARNEHRKDSKNKESDAQGFIGDDTDKGENKNYGCIEESKLIESENFNTKQKVSFYEFGSRNKKLRNLELRFHDDLNNTKRDYGNGEIAISEKMNSQLSIRRASVFKRGFLPTTFDLVFEPTEIAPNIPVLPIDYIDSLIKKENLRGFGGHLLVELDQASEDVELDVENKYEAKFYLNNQMKVVNRYDSDYQFVLFLGVEVGNVQVNFVDIDGQNISKLLHIQSSEVFYEPNFYAKIEYDTFSLFEESLLSSCKSIINIEPSKVSNWSFENNFSKEALNKISMRNSIYPVGARKYYELKHLKESIFIGRWNQENIIIPTEDYISYVIGKFDLNQSNSKCIVQLNLAKPIKEIFFNGLSNDNSMDMQINVLDSDGKFYKDFSEESKRVFLMGEDSGLINIKINYKDDSIQYVQSFCSEATYLIEQL